MQNDSQQPLRFEDLRLLRTVVHHALLSARDEVAEDSSGYAALNSQVYFAAASIFLIHTAYRTDQEMVNVEAARQIVVCCVAHGGPQLFRRAWEQGPNASRQDIFCDIVVDAEAELRRVGPQPRISSETSPDRIALMLEQTGLDAEFARSAVASMQEDGIVAKGGTVHPVADQSRTGTPSAAPLVDALVSPQAARPERPVRARTAVDNSARHLPIGDVEERLLTILPHFKVSLIAAGYTKEQADLGIGALAATLLGPPAVAEVTASGTEHAGAKLELAEPSPGGASLHSRENRLWGLALGRGDVSLTDRASALATLSQFYRRAAEAVGRSPMPEDGEVRARGRPQQHTEEELFEISMDVSQDFPSRLRALSAIFNRWQRLARKNRDI